jgi:hypothetical protein
MEARTGVCFVILALCVPAAHAQSDVHRFMPAVTIVQETTHWGDHAGKAIPPTVVDKREYAFSADGSQSERGWTNDIHGVSTGKMTWTVKRADGVRAILNAEARQVYAVKGQKGRVEEEAMSPLPGKSCLMNERNQLEGSLKGQTTILGYKVLEIENIVQMPGASARLYQTHFLAPDLNCFSLRTLYRREAVYRGRAEVQFNKTETVSILKGEPDAALFRLPRDWKRVGPRLLFETNGAAADRNLEPTIQRMEQDWKTGRYDGE